MVWPVFSFVTLLEYAEEVLYCNHVIVYFKKNRADQRKSTALLLDIHSFRVLFSCC